MTKDIINAAEDRMKKTLDALKKEYGTLRAGRAAPSLLDKVMVDYYGTPTPVNQIANVTVPEPRMLMISLTIKALSKILNALFRNLISA